MESHVSLLSTSSTASGTSHVSTTRLTNGIGLIDFSAILELGILKQIISPHRESSQDCIFSKVGGMNTEDQLMADKRCLRRVCTDSSSGLRLVKEYLSLHF